MPNPYDVLGASPDDNDDAIRQKYLATVRLHPPERSPAAFQRAREAYELIKDEDRRLRMLLFEPAQGESLDELIEEAKCQTSRKRIGLSALLSLLNEGR